MLPKIKVWAVCNHCVRTVSVYRFAGGQNRVVVLLISALSISPFLSFETSVLYGYNLPNDFLALQVFLQVFCMFLDYIYVKIMMRW